LSYAPGPQDCIGGPWKPRRRQQDASGDRAHAVKTTSIVIRSDTHDEETDPED